MNDDTPTPPGADTAPDPNSTAGTGGSAQPSAEQVSWAAQYGLIRPRHGRILAGVCAALGRATNTDPLLWRVLIGVLSIFGIGIVIYVAGWLLTPAEQDSASPIEALFGRGHSSTSSTLTLILGMLAVILIGGITNSVTVAAIAAAGLVIAALVVNRNGVSAAARPPGAPSVPYPAPVGPVAMATNPAPVTASEPPAYRPAFAPHGPYAPTPPPPPPPPQPPQPKSEPSRLGRLIFGMVLITLGALFMTDLAGVSIPATTYLAAVLAVIGVGLIIGAWVGRARIFILLGIVLSLLLPAVAGVTDWRDERSQAGSVRWAPVDFDQLADQYDHRFGEATLDLTGLDFTGRDVRTRVRITGGSLRVIVPDNVDAIVYSNVNLGNADVFGHSINGAGVESQEVDLGPDGKGGGALRLDLEVSLANAEVVR